MAQHIFPFLLFAGLIGFLVFLQVKHGAPFDFKRLRGNHPGEPLPTVFAPTVSQEDGSVLSSTPGAKAIGALMAICLIGLFVILISALRHGIFPVFLS